jgi:hypothetical protein
VRFTCAFIRCAYTFQTECFSLCFKLPVRLCSADMKHIAITKDNYYNLRLLYENSISAGKKPNDVVMWKGTEMLVGYLKYVVEYMKGIVL